MTGTSAHQSAPELTIIIPVYNRETIVTATLKTIVEQTLRPLNIILVDNNSTDNTFYVLQEWKRVNDSPDFRITLLTETKPGAAAARNRGLDAVTTPYTMFFDSDDLMLPGHCHRVINGVHKHPDADILGWDCRSRAIDGNTFLVRFGAEDIFWNNLHQGSMATQRYVARTTLFRQAGGWNERCMGWDDIEIGTRLLAMNPKIVRLSGDISVEIISLENSITGKSFSAKPAVWEHSMELIEDTIKSKVNPRLRDKYLRFLNLRRAILAGDYSREGAMNDGKRLLQTVIDGEESAFYRRIYSAAYRYRALGGRGTHKIFRFLF